MPTSHLIDNKITYVQNMSLALYAELITTMFRRTSSIWTMSSNDPVFNDTAEDVNLHFYTWTVTHKNMSTPLHFKLMLESNCATLYMAYDEETLTYIPCFRFANSSLFPSGFNTTTKVVYYSMQVIETEADDILIVGGYKAVNNSKNPPEAVEACRVPTCAFLNSKNWETNDTSIICAGFSSVTSGGSELIGSSFYPYLYPPTIGPVVNAARAFSMSIANYIAPDIDPNATYGIKIPRWLCTEAASGYDKPNTDSTYSTDLGRIPGGSQITDAYKPLLADVKTEMMIPIASPFSKYVPQYAGWLNFTNGVRDGLGSFNGQTYLFYKNLAFMCK